MYTATIGSKDIQVVTGKSSSINGKTAEILFLNSGPHSFVLTIDGKSKDADFVKFDKENKLIVLRIEGKKYSIQIKEPVDQMLDNLGISIRNKERINNPKAPFPGLVIKIVV